METFFRGDLRVQGTRLIRLRTLDVPVLLVTCRELPMAPLEHAYRFWYI